MKPISLDSRLKKTDAGQTPEMASCTKRIPLDNRLQTAADGGLMEIRAGQFPLEGQSFRSLFRSIDLLEMDGVGLYGCGRFPFGMLPPQLLTLLRDPRSTGEEELSFDGAAANLWQLLWEEYHAALSEKTLAKPRNPKKAARYSRLLRELLITPLLRIDALRNMPHRRDLSFTRTLSVYPAGGEG